MSLRHPFITVIFFDCERCTIWDCHDTEACAKSVCLSAKFFNDLGEKGVISRDVIVSDIGTAPDLFSIEFPESLIAEFNHSLAGLVRQTKTTILCIDDDLRCSALLLVHLK